MSKFNIGDRVAYHPDHYDDDLMGTVIGINRFNNKPKIDLDNGIKGWMPSDNNMEYLRVTESANKDNNKDKSSGLIKWKEGEQ